MPKFSSLLVLLRLSSAASARNDLAAAILDYDGSFRSARGENFLPRLFCLPISEASRQQSGMICACLEQARRIRRNNPRNALAVLGLRNWGILALAGTIHTPFGGIRPRRVPNPLEQKRRRPEEDRRVEQRSSWLA